MKKFLIRFSFSLLSILQVNAQNNELSILDSIDLSKKNNFNTLSVSEFLQGKISGMDVIRCSGEQGKGSQIITDGINISGNNQPLVIIDGIPFTRQEYYLNNFISNSENVFQKIPVALNDISSIEIIKNPVSVLIYGAEGVDGVILIETKNSASRPFEVEYQYNYSIHQKPNFPKMLNGDQYIMLQLEEWHNSKGVFEIPKEIAYDRDYPQFNNYSVNTNWIDAVSQNGFSSNHYLSLKGQNKKVRYYSSFDYQNQKGTLINTGYTRFLNRSKVDLEISKKMSAQLNFSFVTNQYDGNYVLQDENDQNRDILEMAFIKAPNMSIWEYDEFGNLTGNYFSPVSNYQGSSRNYYNPVAVSEYGDTKNDLNTLNTSLSFNYDIANWLQFKEILSYENSTMSHHSTLPQYAISPNLFNSQEIIGNTNNLDIKTYRTVTQVKIDVPFSEKNIHAFSWHNHWVSQIEKFAFQPVEYPLNQNYNNRKKHAAKSFINYSLKNRYRIDLYGNIENFSWLYETKKWNSHVGGFINWVFTEEPFFGNINFIDHGDVYIGTSSSKYDYNAVFPYISIFYRREKQNLVTYKGGMNLSLFNNRLILSSSYKHMQLIRNNAILPFRVKIIENINNLEAALNYSLIEKNDWSAMINLNIIHNDYLIKELPDHVQEILFTLSGGEYNLKKNEGAHPYSIYGLNYQGVYSTDDDAIALDQNGNAMIDELGDPKQMTYMGIYRFSAGDTKYQDANYDGAIDVNDLISLGNSYPKYIGGFGTDIRYKSFLLSMNFHYRFGYKIINQIAMDSESMISKDNQSIQTLNRWQTVGDDSENMLHRAYLDNPANQLGSNRYVESGDFITLNNIGLSYSMPSDFLKKLFIQRLSLEFSMQNLYTFSSYSGLSPEIEVKSYDLSYMVKKDEIRNIPNRIFTIGIKANL